MPRINSWPFHRLLPAVVLGNTGYKLIPGMSFKPPQLIPLLSFTVLLLLSDNVIADSTFYSVNILKALFYSTPHAHINFPDAFNLLSPEAILPAFDPVSCACGSNGLVDGSRTCNSPPSPPLFNQTSVLPPMCFSNHAFLLSA